MRELRAAVSYILAQSIEELPLFTERANLVRLEHELMQALLEELSDKLIFHKQCPYSAIRIYWSEFPGGDVEQARGFARDGIQEYDSLVAKGLGNRLHRAAHLIYGMGTECRWGCGEG